MQQTPGINKKPTSHFIFLSALFLFGFGANLCAQSSFKCTPTATNLVNHAEGLAEPSGDIYLNCTGGTPGTVNVSNLILSYSTAVTNRLNGAGNPDVVLTVDTGSGPVAASVTPILEGANSLAFNGLSITIPATGTFVIHITNVRLAMALIGANHSINVNFSTNSLPLTSSSVTVATGTTGLLATYPSTGISCIGSLLPTTINWANLLATGTNFASTRVTEGFATSFVPKDPTSDAGTRILLRYSNFPAGATLYLPDFVAGNDALIPTAAGDLSGVPSPGAYTPGGLLLARVANADVNGAGGTPMGTAATVSAGVLFSTLTQVPLTSGAGSAVYEVVDANPNIQEWAQFPTFVGLPNLSTQAPVVATEQISFGPYSTVSTAMAGLPVPRFSAPLPPNDCSVVGDCGANYFPVLTATAANLQFLSGSSGNVLTQFILVNNTGGGYMQFSTSVAYTGSATGWLTVTNENITGNQNHTTLAVTANPAGLAQGTYQAAVTVNAGTAGTQSFTYTLTVGPPQITISSIVNAASFQTGPLVAGSLATIKGTNLSGKVVTVTFNGIGGTVLYDSAGQINVQVPSSLASSSSAQVVVTADGNSSAAATVQLASISPGIFGVLNQDNSVNSPTNPAPPGTVIQIFATGLISPVSSGQIITGLGNTGIPTLYSGAAADGVQQVNAQLPTNAASLPGILVVCGNGTTGSLVCSPAFIIYTK
jgi:uncharacterized protein (TIGR03437 family)